VPDDQKRSIVNPQSHPAPASLFFEQTRPSKLLFDLSLICGVPDPWAPYTWTLRSFATSFFLSRIKAFTRSQMTDVLRGGDTGTYQRLRNFTQASPH